MMDVPSQRSARRVWLRSALITVAVALGAILVLLVSCQRWIRVEVTEPTDAMTPRDGWGIPRIWDDLDRASLFRAIDQSLLYVERLPVGRRFQYGPYLVAVKEVGETLRAFRRLLEENLTDEALAVRLGENFMFLKAAGRDIFGRVLFTGYFEPLLEGSLDPVGAYRYPIYRRPEDLVEIDLGSFDSRLEGEKIAGRWDKGKFIPYYSRAEIDGGAALAKRGLEIAWLDDPIGRFFLHIQGSGQIRLRDERRLHVGFAASNGHAYRSIGGILLDEGAIPREEISMQAIAAYLRSHPDRLDEILFSNPRYIFFRVLEDGPLGSINVSLTPGRSIATDSRLFPPGALCFLETHKPIFDRRGLISGWAASSRFALNQDTGAAMRGAGRVDIFFGAGREAEMSAGHLQHEGKLYFLLKKSSFLTAKTTDQ